MACSAATSMASNPKACISSISSSGSISLASSFSGKPFASRVPRFLASHSSSSSKRGSFAVRAGELPLVGNTAPDFEAEAVFDQEFIKVKLSEYVEKKYVILFFYPLDFTFVCPTEITAFSDRYEEFQKLNTEVLGVSVDSVFSHLAWVQTNRKSGGLGDLNYPLVSYVTKSISKSYNVLTPDQGIAVRGLFIIDKEGVIQHSTINNLGIGRSVDETLRTLQALQYVQDNPDEVCSTGWKPGEKSIDPFHLSLSHLISLRTCTSQTMQESLHCSSSSTTPLPFHNSKFPSISRLKHLHFPSNSSSKPLAVSLPKPTSIKSPENETPPIISPPPVGSSQIQDLLLYLDSLGVDSLYCLNSYPPLISTPLSQIRSTVDFLYSLGLTTHELRRIFPMCPELLTSSTFEIIIPATTFLLREALVKATDLPHVIHRRPRLLICSVERQLRPALYFLQGTIGIESVAKSAPLLSCSVELKFIPRIEYLQKLGFSYRDTITMFRRFPSMFCYSIKKNFELKFDYFVVEMGRELKELVAFPQYFSFSLENRIKPRHKICVEKGISLALPTLLKMSDAKFQERLEVFCSSSGPLRCEVL